MCVCVCVCVCVLQHWGTHREEHDGHSECDSSEHSQTHQQKHGVKLVDLCEGVQ